METIDINSLQPDPKNPRKISREQFTKLQKVLKRFGDLGGIVKNLETGELVGGHMRVEAFKADTNATSTIQINQRFDQATEAGTVALGYVMVNGEPFSYREVLWSRPLQKAANLAANHAGGDDDIDLLEQVIYELNQENDSAELLALTAIEDDDLNKLLGLETSEPEKENDSSPGHVSLKFDTAQLETVEEAIQYVLSKHQVTTGNPDIRANAVYYICQQYLQRIVHDGLDSPTQTEEEAFKTE